MIIFPTATVFTTVKKTISLLPGRAEVGTGSVQFRDPKICLK